jgi:hypothetical protein
VVGPAGQFLEVVAAGGVQVAAAGQDSLVGAPAADGGGAVASGDGLQRAGHRLGVLDVETTAGWDGGVDLSPLLDPGAHLRVPGPAGQGAQCCCPVGQQHPSAVGLALVLAPGGQALVLGRGVGGAVLDREGLELGEALVPGVGGVLDQAGDQGGQVGGRGQVEGDQAGAAGAVLAAAAGLGAGVAVELGGQAGVEGAQAAQDPPDGRERAGGQGGVLVQVRAVADRDQDLAGLLAGGQAKSSADGLDDPDVAGLGVGEQDAVDGGDVDSFGEAAGAGDHDEGGRVGVLEGRQGAGAVQGRVSAGDGDRADPAPVGQVGSVDGLGEGSGLGDAAVEGEDSREPGGGGGSQCRDRVRGGLAGGLVDEDLVVAEQLALDGLGEVEAVDDRAEQGGVGHGQRCRPVVPSGLGRGGDGVDLGSGHEHARCGGHLGAKDDPEVGAGWPARLCASSAIVRSNWMPAARAAAAATGAEW